jgi:uncharacterized membrane protein YeaQ/YmgE (transglycosylase-associated protein family)
MSADGRKFAKCRRTAAKLPQGLPLPGGRARQVAFRTIHLEGPMRDPAVTLVVILIIGIVAGIVFDRVAGPGWLTRQIAGSTRGLVTSSLIGIAGAFLGYHVLALGTAGYAPFIGAVIGAALVLWVWRMIK